MADFGWLSGRGSLGKGSPAKGQIGHITVVVTELWSSATTKGGMDQGSGRDYGNYGSTHEFFVFNADGDVIEHGHAKGTPDQALAKAESHAKSWFTRTKSTHVDRSGDQDQSGGSGYKSGGQPDPGAQNW